MQGRISFIKSRSRWKIFTMEQQENLLFRRMSFVRDVKVCYTQSKEAMIEFFVHLSLQCEIQRFFLPSSELTGLFLLQVVVVVKELHKCACHATAQECRYVCTSCYQVWFSRCPQSVTAAKVKGRESTTKTAAKHVQAGRSCGKKRFWRSTSTKVREKPELT